MSKKILSVDDSDNTRKWVQFALKAKGFESIQAEDGLAALELLKQEPVAAIILDINMPRMNGLEFLQKIKAETAYATIPVVILSAEGQNEDKERAFALGAAKYIVKPFAPAQLVSALEAVLQGS
ncbi:MAG: response regulator [Desulfobacteraceae bacterium]|nr:response regulator [Desulfobacteraceae bacterium]